MEVAWNGSVAVEIVTCAIYLENFVNLWVRLSLWETPVGYPWEGCLEVLLFRGPFGQGLRAAVRHGGGRGTVCAYEQGQAGSECPAHAALFREGPGARAKTSGPPAF